MMEITKSLAPIIIITALRQLDDKDPDVIFWLRVTSFVAFAMLFSIYFIIRYKILKRNEQTQIQVVSTDLETPNALQAFVSSGENESEDAQTMSVAEFDINHFNRKAKQTLMQVVIVAVMHLKWNFVLPIVISPVIALLNIFSWQLFRMYIVGTSEAEDPLLKRPWKTPPNPLMAMLSGEPTPAVPAAPKITGTRRRKAD